MEPCVSLSTVPSTSSESDNSVKDVLSLVTTAQTTVTTVTKQRISSPSKGSMLAKMLINHSASKCRETSRPGNQGSQGVPKVSESLGRKRETTAKSVHKPIVTKHRKTETAPKVPSKVQITVNPVSGSISSTQSMPKPNPSSLQVVTLSSSGIGQLSPSLESRLQQSTGVIENLDRFCAVADIVAEDEDEDEDGEIDIENEDEENPILKSRSASPNSVYEQLIRAANLNKSPEKVRNKEVLIEPEKSPEVASNQNEAVSPQNNEKEAEMIQDTPDIAHELYKQKSSE